MSASPTTWSYAQLQARWQSLVSGQFDQDGFMACLIATHRDLPKQGFLRAMGEIMAQEAALEEPFSQKLRLEEIGDWPMTIRIDGIMPMRIPLARDIGELPRAWMREMDLLGFESPTPLDAPRVERGLGLCLLGWFHQRQLVSDYGLSIELTTQCPRSALGAKDEICVMGQLPNGSRITVFFSGLKGSDCLAMPAASAEHYDILEAKQDQDGVLRLRGRDGPDDGSESVASQGSANRL
jgi:hypothetical protein